MKTEQEIIDRCKTLDEIKQSRMTGNPDEVSTDDDHRIDAGIRTLRWVLGLDDPTPHKMVTPWWYKAEHECVDVCECCKEEYDESEPPQQRLYKCGKDGLLCGDCAAQREGDIREMNYECRFDE